jgi:primase-polymerase (primpol)-like protein
VIPPELTERDQWVCWCWPTKAPLVARDPRRHARADDPGTWGTHAEATAAGCDGVGYVFSVEEPFADPFAAAPDGELHEDAAAVVDALDSYTEWSPSRRGLKVFVRADFGAFGGNRKTAARWGGALEVWDRRKYSTVTGLHVGGTPTTIEPRQAELERVAREHLKRGGVGDDELDLDGEQDPLWAPMYQVPPDGLASDEELIAWGIEHVDGFAEWWAGEIEQWGGDPSRADLALCNRLVRLTLGDRARAEELFGASALADPAMRPGDHPNKWQERPDYRRLTIGKAMARYREMLGC